MNLKRMGLIAAGLLLSAAAFAERDSSIEVMFYNVENLFDAVHDEGKSDWTYLPQGYPGKAAYCETVQVPVWKKECDESDWTQSSVDLKLRQIKRALTAGDHALPDILGLGEVENDNVVGMLARELGYQQFVVSNSPDNRGIDVALLFNETQGLSFVRSREHEVRLSGGERATRNVLEVEFETANHDRLFVLVNHWPSQSNPVQNRIAAAKVVQQVVDQRMAKNPSNHVMVIGDFNVVDTDVPNPIKTVLQAPKAANPLADARDLYNNHPNVTQSEKEQMPKGSYFYIKNMQWNTLDKILLTQNLIDGKGVELIQESFRTHAPESLTRLFRYNERHQGPRPTLRIPWRYDILATQEDEAGFSDHFAIYVRLRLQ